MTPEIRFDVADDVPEGEIPAARDRIHHLQKLREELRKKLTTAQERQKRYYDQRHVPKQFKRGDLVKLSVRTPLQLGRVRHCRSATLATIVWSLAYCLMM